ARKQRDNSGGNSEKTAPQAAYQRALHTPVPTARLARSSLPDSRILPICQEQNSNILRTLAAS
ncbi:MAG TPA: hypothetical protein VGR70_07450, partial [Stellaceae bacterium]|nr:hypothetical protein [Stellaceae bacterium]